MAEVRYHLDENMHEAVALGLRLRSIDVTTTAEARLLGASDEEQLRFAISQQRILVTRDHDFVALSATVEQHPGIVFARQGRRVIGTTVLALARLHRTQTAEQMINRMEFL
jgi:predicted nuclease of predicted toxin-antitoxin system